MARARFWHEAAVGGTARSTKVIPNGQADVVAYRKKMQGEERMGRKIAIVGAGAVGGYAGAHMAQAGEDVTFIDPWPEHVEHMQRDGLKISHIRDVPEFTAKVRAMHVTDAQQLAKEPPIDIAFVC